MRIHNPEKNSNISLYTEYQSFKPDDNIIVTQSDLWFIVGQGNDTINIIDDEIDYGPNKIRNTDILKIYNDTPIFVNSSNKNEEYIFTYNKVHKENFMKLSIRRDNVDYSNINIVIPYSEYNLIKYEADILVDPDLIEINNKLEY